MSWVILRQRFSRKTLASLVVVAGGVALSAFTEFQFSFVGFAASLVSAFAMSVANTYQKRYMHKGGAGHGARPHGDGYGDDDGDGDGGGNGDDDGNGDGDGRAKVGAAATSSLPGSLPGIRPSPPSCLGAIPEGSGGSPDDASLDKDELFFLTNLYSFALMFPLWWHEDWHRLTALGAPPPSGYILALALTNTAPAVMQHFLSVTLLALISPVSHSIVNSCKRIVVIVLSICYFHNPVSALNVFGMVCAVGGVFLYNRALGEDKEIFAPASPQHRKHRKHFPGEASAGGGVGSAGGVAHGGGGGATFRGHSHGGSGNGGASVADDSDDSDADGPSGFGPLSPGGTHRHSANPKFEGQISSDLV